MTTKEASERWGISERRVRVLCSEGKIAGAVQEGRGWKIPIDSQKPSDGRFKSRESIFEQIDRNVDNNSQYTLCHKMCSYEKHRRVVLPRMAYVAKYGRLVAILPAFVLYIGNLLFSFSYYKNKISG